MNKQAYDLLVIGAGGAGSTAATTAAKNGARVALVECDQVGGTCLNYGCDPTKTLLHIANMLYQAQHAERYGLHIAEAKADWTAVQAWVHQVINRIRGGTSEEAARKISQDEGIDVMKGKAHFVSPHEISVAGQTIMAERIIIATGSKTTIPEMEGLKEAGYITNIEAVSLPKLPRSLAVIGGGAIGMEFAQMFHRFGVNVTVLEHNPTLLDKEDHELSEQLCNLLTKQGMRLETDTELLRVRRDGECKRLTICCGKREEEELLVDEILVALGRQPECDSLHLEAAGVKSSKKGIEVDSTLRTNIPHIWAAGDVTGGYQFTHVAYEQGKLAAQNAFAKEPQPFDDRVIPWVTYTDPELAHVGKTEEELREAKVEYRVLRKTLDSLERAIAEGKTDGLVKLLVDKHGMLLGGHILAPRAGDLLAPIIVAMHAGLNAEMLATTILPYPTMAEAVRWAADEL